MVHRLAAAVRPNREPIYAGSKIAPGICGRTIVTGHPAGVTADYGAGGKREPTHGHGRRAGEGTRRGKNPGVLAAAVQSEFSYPK
jgi:hypothetical protein